MNLMNALSERGIDSHYYNIPYKGPIKSAWELGNKISALIILAPIKTALDLVYFTARLTEIDSWLDVPTAREGEACNELMLATLEELAMKIGGL